MDEPFLGQIMLFAGDYVPQGWTPCDGRLLSIMQSNSLYQLLGTNYGGDGVNTFAIPDLRGRVPMHFGQGTGLSNRLVGQQLGSEFTTLTQNQMPAHQHAINGTFNLQVNANNDEVSDSPEGCYLKQTPGVNSYSTTTNGFSCITQDGLTVQIAGIGNSNPYSNLQPTLPITFCIATTGFIPPR